MKRTHPKIPSFRTRAWLTLLCGCLLATGARALPGDSEQPMNITADRGTFYNNRGEANFVGNVYLKQGTLEVWADTLDVIRDPETGDIEFLEAHGQPARYQQVQEVGEPPLKVRGLRIEYKPDEDVIITEGEGHVEQAGNTTEGHFIRYNLTEETLEVRSLRAEGQDEDAPQATWTLQPEAVE